MKVTGQKKLVTYKGKPIKASRRFFNRNFASQKGVTQYSQSAEWENYAAKNTLYRRLLFRIGGDVESFPDKQKLKEFETTKPALQEILKGTLCVGKKDQKQQRLERKREKLQKQPLNK